MELSTIIMHVGVSLNPLYFIIVYFVFAKNLFGVVIFRAHFHFGPIDLHHFLPRESNSLALLDLFNSKTINFHRRCTRRG